jgi:hypothetical protein
MLQNPGENFVVKNLGSFLDRLVFLVVNSTTSSSLKKLAKFWISHSWRREKTGKKRRKRNLLQIHLEIPLNALRASPPVLSMLLWIIKLNV